MRERLYDAACLILTDKKGGVKGEFTEPNEEFGFRLFANSLTAHAMSYSMSRNK